MLGSGPYQVGISVSDFVSGVDEANSTLFGHVATDTVGPKSATFTALDFAGNSATKECTYSVIYDFGGFYPPVNPAPARRRGQGGQRDPAQVQPRRRPGARESSTQGYPASGSLDCKTMDPSDDLQPTKSAGGSGLTYDSASGQYTYVWKTEKAWAGTCRYLSLQLSDGTEHRAAVPVQVGKAGGEP